MLLRIALASSPSSGLFPHSQLIGRMRSNSGVEIVINAIPFAPSDRLNVRTFVERGHGLCASPAGCVAGHRSECVVGRF
jgi:hypothetical protein